MRTAKAVDGPWHGVWVSPDAEGGSIQKSLQRPASSNLLNLTIVRFQPFCGFVWWVPCSWTIINIFDRRGVQAKKKRGLDWNPAGCDADACSVNDTLFVYIPPPRKQSPEKSASTEIRDRPQTEGENSVPTGLGHWEENRLTFSTPVRHL